MFVHDEELVKRLLQICENGKLIDETFIEVFSESEKIILSECGDFVFSLSFLAEEHAIDSQPDLSFDFGQSISIHFFPLSIFKSLFFAIHTLSNPRFVFQDRNQNAWNIIFLHHLIDDRHI